MSLDRVVLIVCTIDHRRLLEVLILSQSNIPAEDDFAQKHLAGPVISMVRVRITVDCILSKVDGLAPPASFPTVTLIESFLALIDQLGLSR